MQRFRSSKAEWRRRGWTSIALVALMAVVVAACSAADGEDAVPDTTAPPSGQTTTTAEPSDSVEEPPPGGTFVGAWIGPCCSAMDETNLMLILTDSMWWSKVHGRLFVFEEVDGNFGEIQGDLAESWSVSDDGLTWTINLRPGVTWHDGEPLTAEDVKFSMEVCLDPATGGCLGARSLTTIAGFAAMQEGEADELVGVEIVDEQTLLLTTDEPNVFLPHLLSEFWIFPQHSLGMVPREEIAGSDWWTTQQIGTGPFMWSRYNPGESIELVRNPDYWRGAPVLERIIRRNFSDVSAALLAFENGEIDFTFVTTDEVPRLRESEIGTVVGGSSGITNVLLINPVRHPELQNRDFRTALMHAIDREAIVSVIYGGMAEVASCVFGPTSIHSKGVEPHAYDPELARELLERSGVDVAGFRPLTLDTYYQDSVSANVVTAIQSYWEENLGIVSEQRVMDIPTWRDYHFEQGAHSISLAGQGYTPYGERTAQYWHSDGAYPAGANGFVGYNYENPEVEALYDAARAEFDPAAQIEIYQQLCQVLNDDLPGFHMWEISRFNIFANGVENFRIIPTSGGSYYDAVETWTSARP